MHWNFQSFRLLFQYYMFILHMMVLYLYLQKTLLELTTLTKDPKNSGAEVLYLSLAGHFQNREDVVRFNAGVLFF